jgi:AAA15 family ATPase/GTPase
MLEFGSWYETFKSIGEKILNGQTPFEPEVLDTIKDIISAILDGKYHYEKETVYIYNRVGKLNIANCSSGQQELLPLILVVSSLPFYRFAGDGVSIYIEEPEVHLFPECQKVIMDLLFFTFNRKRGKCQYFITTHSPYIISSINLALQANEYVNRVGSRNGECSERDFKMDYNEIAAYSVVDGCSDQITNDEYRIIETGLVDKISDFLMEKYAFYTEAVSG